MARLSYIYIGMGYLFIQNKSGIDDEKEIKYFISM